MSIKFRITKYLAVSALAMLLLGACSKNNIYIDLADPNEENGNNHPSGNDSGNDLSLIHISNYYSYLCDFDKELVTY